MADKRSPKTALSRRTVLAGMSAGGAMAAFPFVPARAASLDTDVLVIGAGLSGLYATLVLEEAGVNVRLIEARDEVGGRVRTAKEEEVPGHPELGASGIGGHYSRMIAAAQRFGLPLVRERPRTDPRKGKLMYNVLGENVRVEDWASHPRNPFEDEKLRKMMLPYIQYMRDDNPLPVGDLEAWQSGAFAAHDISVYDYFKAKGVSDMGIRLGSGTNLSYGTDERDLSILMGYQIFNLSRSLYGEGSSFDRTPRAGKGGNQRVPEAMASGLATEPVFNQHVVAMRSDASGIEVHTRTGAVHRAKYVICTLPFSALRFIHMDPVFEGRQAEAIHTLGYVPVFQVHFEPTRKFWEADGLPPSMWTDRTPGRFMGLQNDPSNPEEITSFVAFVNGHMAHFLDAMSPEDAANTVLSELAQMRPSTKGALKTRKVFSWIRDPFSGGAYAYWKPGQITRFAQAMRQPFKRVHLAGEHTAILTRGMEGAMESGERAAFEVLERML